MELKGSKTEMNLLAAFAGESQARNKYNYFASAAKKAGYEQIADFFNKTAENEKEHAKLWFKALSGINSTEENLLAAADPPVSKNLDSAGMVLRPLFRGNLLQPTVDFSGGTGTGGNGNDSLSLAPLQKSAVVQLHPATVAQGFSGDNVYGRNNNLFPVKKVLQHLPSQFPLELTLHVKHGAAATAGVIRAGWCDSVGGWLQNGQDLSPVIVFLARDQLHLGNLSRNETR